jgi:hypothetical protein
MNLLEIGARKQSATMILTIVPHRSCDKVKCPTNTISKEYLAYTYNTNEKHNKISMEN